MEILEIANRVKRTSHRMKNAGNLDLFKKGVAISNKIKKIGDPDLARKYEGQYLETIKKQYDPQAPIQTPVQTQTQQITGITTHKIMNADGYDDPGDDFNPAAAITELNSNAQPNYTGQCAQYVREALEAGGVDTTGHPVSAKDYGPFLDDNGFSAIDNTNINNPEAGDIVVIQPNADGSHPDGHIAMFNGTNWISDTTQRSYSAGLTGPYQLYRPDK